MRAAELHGGCYQPDAADKKEIAVSEGPNLGNEANGVLLWTALIGFDSTARWYSRTSSNCIKV